MTQDSRPLMTSIPATSSILSASHLANFLREKYYLSDNTTCRLIKAGINHTYLVTDQADKYIFRVYSLDWRTEKEVLEEIKLINHLKIHDIPVSYAIADRNNHYLQEFQAAEGKRLAVLFSYAYGEKLLNYLPEVHFNIGALMAKIHQQTHDFTLERVNYTPKVLLMDSFEHLKKFLSPETDEMIFMETTQGYLLNYLKEVDTDKIRKGVVHLDIWFDNLNIDSTNKVTLFDFDFCGNGWLCYDIAYYILQVHSTERDDNECQMKVAAFLEGYESITKIGEEEKRILPMLGVTLYFFYLGIQCQRYENWSNTFLNDVYLKRFINLLVKKYFEKYLVKGMEPRVQTYTSSF